MNTLTSPEHDPTTSALDSILLARQPILDRNGRVRAYELLYRGKQSDLSSENGSDVATASVLHAAIMSLRLDALTPGCPAFLNVTRNLLMQDIGALLSPGTVVIEVLETIEIDDEVFAACGRLREQGHALAIDDFIPGSSAERLFPLAQYLKLDVLSLDADARQRILASAPKHLKRLAEKVETREMHAATLADGFELFQGYFFCRPSTFQMRDMSVQQTASLRLLDALNRPAVSTAEIDDLIRHDASLCQRVLRYVNSAALGMARPIHSIRQALMLIGFDQIRKWVSVWSLAGLNRSGVPEALTMAIVRARWCEQLSVLLHGPDGEGAPFLLGLCSMLDVLLDRPMNEILISLSLPESTSDALLGRLNGERLLLDLVVAYEQGDWDAVTSAASRAGIDIKVLPATYADALRWATSLSN